jgi:hypothetical protein
VDRINFTSREEVETLLRNYEFLSSGIEAIVLKSKTEPEIVIRLELYNHLGRDWTINFLTQLSSSDNQPSHQEEYEDALTMLNSAGKLYDTLAQYAKKRVRERVAAHNAQFRRDPSSTIPINLVYTFKDIPFAVRMKYLQGTAAEGTAAELDRQIDLTGDTNPNNTLTNIANSPHKTQMIDLKNFVPSDKALDSLSKPK